MSDPLMPSTGTGLRFQLFGVPIQIGPSIIVILALFGLGADNPVVIAMWVAIGVASIVVHELGHALVARLAGANPTIQLAGLGGVTRYLPEGRSGERRWQLAISLAGPTVGLAVGALALWSRAVLGIGASGGYEGAAVQILLFTSIGWSVFNLLPILPLDGGQALRQLLPGDDTTRTVRAAWVGTVTSAVLVALAVWQNQLFVAVLGGLFAAQNYRSATSARATERDRQGLQQLLHNRDFRGLRDALADGRGDHAVAEAAQIGALEHGEHQLAAEIGEVVLARGTDDPRFAERAAEAWRELGMEDRAERVLARSRGEGTPPLPETPGGD